MVAVSQLLERGFGDRPRLRTDQVRSAQDRSMHRANKMSVLLRLCGLIMSFRTAAAESLGFANRFLDPTKRLGQIDLTNKFGQKPHRFVSVRLESDRKNEDRKHPQKTIHAMLPDEFAPTKCAASIQAFEHSDARDFPDRSAVSASRTIGELIRDRACSVASQLVRISLGFNLAASSMAPAICSPSKNGSKVGP